MTPENIALKRATEAVIKGVGGYEASAMFCRLGKSVLHDAQAVHRVDRFLPIDAVAALEPLAREREGWPHITRALCAANGGTFVALPEVQASGADLFTLLAKQQHEAGELTAALAMGIGDGRICGSDARKALSEARDLVAIAAAMVAELELIVREDGE